MREENKKLTNKTYNMWQTHTVYGSIINFEHSGRDIFCAI